MSKRSIEHVSVIYTNFVCYVLYIPFLADSISFDV